MSHRRGKITSINRREKNAIARRLMKISLKVDDYVYKHRQISESDAAMYIEEVSSYKLKCSQDVRSLQVIEKLTRCMKSILAEREELKKSTHSRNDDDANMDDLSSQVITTSPVYSLPDEDRTHLTQFHLDDEETNTNLIVADDIDIKDSCNVEKTKMATIISANLDNIIGEVNIKKGTVSPSLKELQVSSQDLQVTKTVIENFSQSILDNQDNTERILHTTNMTCNNIIEEVNTKIKDVVNDTNISYENNTLKNNPAIAQANEPLVINASNSATSTKLNNNCSQTAKTKEKIKGKAPRKKKTDKKVKDSIKQKKTRKKPSKKINITETAIKNDNTSKFTSNKQDANDTGNLTSPADIYNENMENDLSWIENIRYVREVSAKEFDPTLAAIDQDFWDNCALPDFLDDQDFVYLP